MCYDEGVIQAYIDGELESEEISKIDDHLKLCEKCYKQFVELKCMDDFANDKLAINISHKASEANCLKVKRRGGLRMLGKYRKAAAGLVAVLTIASVIWVAPVRNAAADFLSIFRVSKFKAVTFTAEDFNEIQRQFYENGIEKNIKNIDLKQYGNIKVSGGGFEHMDSRDISTLKGRVGFAFELPETPDDYVPNGMSIENPVKIEITPYVNKLNSLISALGGSKMLPAELNGKTFEIETKGVVCLNYHQEVENKPDKRKWLSISMMANPNIRVPDGIDLEEVRQAALELPFLPGNIKQQLSSIKDWKSTLPVPVDSNSQVREVTINGNPAIYMSSLHNNDTLMWVDGDTIFHVNGNMISQSELFSIAESLR